MPESKRVPLRLHCGRRSFNLSKGFKVGLPLTKEELVEALEQRDENKFVQGWTWLCRDMAERALDCFDYPSDLGEELTIVGQIAVWRAMRKIAADANIGSVLMRAIEDQIYEHLSTDRLCRVPRSTRTHRKTAGKQPPNAPRVMIETDWAVSMGRDPEMPNDDRDELYGQHSRLFGQSPNEWTPERIYPHCREVVDRLIVQLRYENYTGRPWPLQEVANELGISRGKVTRRLREIEWRYENAEERHRRSKKS